MNEHIETLRDMAKRHRAFSRQNMGPNDSPSEDSHARQASALDWALSVLDPEKAEGHKSVLLSLTHSSNFTGYYADFLAGAAALARVAELEAENARLRKVELAAKHVAAWELISLLSKGTQTERYKTDVQALRAALRNELAE